MLLDEDHFVVPGTTVVPISPTTEEQELLTQFDALSARLSAVLAVYIALGIMILLLTVAGIALTLLRCATMFRKSSDLNTVHKKAPVKEKKRRKKQTRSQSKSKSKSASSKSTKSKPKKKTGKSDKSVIAKSKNEDTKSGKSLNKSQSGQSGVSQSDKSASKTKLRKIKSLPDHEKRPPSGRHIAVDWHPKRRSEASSNSNSIKATSMDEPNHRRVSRERHHVSFGQGVQDGHNSNTTHKFEAVATKWVEPCLDTTAQLYRSEGCPTPNPFMDPKMMKPSSPTHTSPRTSTPLNANSKGSDGSNAPVAVVETPKTSKKETKSGKTPSMENQGSDTATVDTIKGLGSDNDNSVRMSVAQTQPSASPVTPKRMEASFGTGTPTATSTPTSSSTITTTPSTTPTSGISDFSIVSSISNAVSNAAHTAKTLVSNRVGGTTDPSTPNSTPKSPGDGIHTAKDKSSPTRSDSAPSAQQPTPAPPTVTSDKPAPPSAPPQTQ